MNENNLTPSHLDRFPPSQFGNNTMDLINKSGNFGLGSDEVKQLNIKRYMRNLDILIEDGMKLAIMPEQTNEMVLTALYTNIDAFRFVIDQTPEIKEYVLSVKSDMIRFFHEQTEEEIIYAISVFPNNIHNIKEPTEEYIKMAINLDYDVYNDLDVALKTDEITKYYIDAFYNVEIKDNVKLYDYGDVDYLKKPYNLDSVMNQEIFDYAYNKHPVFIYRVELNLTNVVNQYITMDILKYMAANTPKYLFHIHPDYQKMITLEMANSAVSINCDFKLYGLYGGKITQAVINQVIRMAYAQDFDYNPKNNPVNSNDAYKSKDNRLYYLTSGLYITKFYRSNKPTYKYVNLILPVSLKHLTMFSPQA